MRAAGMRYYFRNSAIAAADSNMLRTSVAELPTLQEAEPALEAADSTFRLVATIK